MPKNDLEQKAILIDLMNSKPLMTIIDWYQFIGVKLSSFEIATQYANYHTQWHLKQAEKVVAEYYTCENCGGNGYTIEVEATCCMRQGYECCGNPEPTQVQIQCYCDNGIIPFDKQSITNAFDNYITNNLK